MKKVSVQYGIKAFFVTIVLAFLQTMAWAQEVVDVKINPENAKSWLANNWVWVALGIVVLLVIIGAASGSSSSRHKKTTIVREDGTGGVVRTTTTTEIIE